MTILTELRQRAEAIAHTSCVIGYWYQSNIDAPKPSESECNCPRAALLEAVAEVEEGIKKMAEQMTVEEMNAEYGDGGDYEYGYNELVKQARALLDDKE